jgi:hypothetical protein
MAVADLCRRHGFSPASFYQWRAKCGGMESHEASVCWPKRTWTWRRSRWASGGKALAPQRKREAVRRMLALSRVSERRACRLAGLSRAARWPRKCCRHGLSNWHRFAVGSATWLARVVMRGSMYRLHLQKRKPRSRIGELT